jgi:hypothetical protein
MYVFLCPLLTSAHRRVSVQAHTRRYTKFVELSKTDDSLVDILDALDAESGSKPAIDTSGNSKRAQKRVCLLGDADAHMLTFR